METLEQPYPSTFDQMVDKLRDKSEEALKMLYINFFANDLSDEWVSLTKEADFKNADEEEIVKGIQKNRYKKYHV